MEKEKIIEETKEAVECGTEEGFEYPECDIKKRFVISMKINHRTQNMWFHA